MKRDGGPDPVSPLRMLCGLNPDIVPCPDRCQKAAIQVSGKSLFRPKRGALARKITNSDLVHIRLPKPLI